MTFEEAKQRSDYCFRLNGIQLLIRDIREEHLEIDLDNGPLIGEAVLEIGYFDIEVNISVLKLRMTGSLLDILGLKQMWIGGVTDGKKSWKKICF